jgi:hypothetical protein
VPLDCSELWLLCDPSGPVPRRLSLHGKQRTVRCDLEAARRCSQRAGSIEPDPIPRWSAGGCDRVRSAPHGQPGERRGPVPSARAAVRERGFDATWALARGAARLLRRQTPVRTGRLLHHARSVRDQAGLSAAQRATNLQGAFRVTSAAPCPPLIVVDDVVTTGSSLTEAARALREAGHHVLGAATVAATQRDRSVSRP